MSRPFHWSEALTALGLVGALAGCAGSMSGPSTASSKVRSDPSKVGLATRAQAALASNDLATAVTLAEQAVENRPQDSSFRALLGNIYLASGRFASAEAAYRDSLSISARQPQIILKMALVQIALGRRAEASDLLAAAQPLLDPTDLGLALALAGRADQAVAILEPTARTARGDARTRQNLALAYALGGDWDSARTIAAQDLPPDQLEGRLEQWLALSKPGQAGAHVAAFIGVTPSAIDPGQPVRLALTATSRTRLAQAEVPAPVVPVPVAQVAEPPVDARMAEAMVVPEPPLAAVAEAPAHVEPVAVAAAPAPGLRSPRPALTPASVRLSQALPEIRRAAMPARGRSRAVVQLGAYGSRAFIPAAWNKAAARHGALRNYTPVIARFDSAKGTFYRLSVKGFASDRQAVELCTSLKRSGASCFVRATFNDAPVRLALR